MSQTKVIIFDVNETLLDLAPLKASLGKALGGRKELLSFWFSTLLHYSLVETLSGHHHGFGEIGTAALAMVAESHGIELSLEDARTSVIGPFQTLPAHAEVEEGLELLSKKGFRLVSLTNSSASTAEAQLAYAGLADRFEKRYSVEKVGKYKPHPDTYRMVLEDLAVRPEEVLMVAAHAWDLMGAKNVGLQTAFIERPGAAIYQVVDRPDYVASDLLKLARMLS